jgi:branched-chain amino acid transport system permease protein
MTSFLTSTTSGFIVGSLYAIMAIGLTIIYGVSHVFNFAHGHVAVIGAYITWLVVGLGVGLRLGLLGGFAGAIAFMVVFGWLLYRVSIRYLLRREGSEFATLLFTLGLAISLEFLLLQLFGPRVKSVPLFTKGSFRLPWGRIGLHQIVLIILSIAIIVGLSIFLKRTRTGLAMRAVASSVPGARIVGIDIDRIFGRTFALAFSLTGVSGVLLGSTVFMTPHIGWEWMIKGFIIVTFGGLGNVLGAIVAAFTLGIVESLVTLYAGTLWIWPAWLLLFVLVLSIRPQGILGGRAA